MINSFFFFFADRYICSFQDFNGQQESTLLLISSRRQNVHLTFFSTSFWMRRNSKTETIPEEIGEMNQEATENKQIQTNLAHKLKNNFSIIYFIFSFFFLVNHHADEYFLSACLSLTPYLILLLPYAHMSKVKEKFADTTNSLY